MVMLAREQKQLTFTATCLLAVSVKKDGINRSP